MSRIKRTLRFFIFHDWLWSVLAAFCCYFVLNLIGPQEIGGVPIGYYAINWPQALIATAGAMAGLMAVVRAGMWFNTRIIHNWTWMKSKNNNVGYDFSSSDFKQLTAWQRFLISVAFFFFFFAFAYFLFLQFLKMGAPVM